MTTLKHYCADEIASAFAAQLKNESFIGMYKQADVQIAPGVKTEWWKTKSGAEFKAKVDVAKTEQELNVAINMLNDPDFKTRLGQEGVADETELQNYANAKELPAAAEDGCAEVKSDEPCAHDGKCPECADASVAIAVDFAIKHVTKVADALDKAGFVGVAEALDDTLRRLAAQRPIKMADPLDDSFKRHLTSKQPQPGVDMFGSGLLSQDIAAMWFALPEPMKDQVLPDWRKADKENLTFNLTSPKVQQKLKNRHDQWNRIQLGQKKTPPPQAGKRPAESVESRAIKLVQRVLGTKADGIWGPITAGAWNTYVKGSPHMKGWEMQGRDTKDEQAPSVETMNAFVQKATGKSPAEVGKGPHGATGI